MTESVKNNKTKSRILRWSAYLLSGVLLLIGGVLLLLYSLLYSETGSRWVLSQARNWIPLTIQQSSGRLGEELTAINLTYQQDGVVVKVDRMTYRITDIDWWQRHLIFDYIRIGQVSISWPENKTPTESQPLPEVSDFQWPLTVTLNELFVEDIQLNDESLAYGPVWGSLSLNDKNIQIDSLHLLDQDITLILAGRLQLNNRWPFHLSTQWAYPPEQITGKGRVRGDITGLLLNQSIQIDNSYATGGGVLEGELTFYPTMTAQVNLNSDRLHLPVADTQHVTTRFNQVEITASGQLDDYQITGKARAEQSIQSLRLNSDNSDTRTTPSIYRNQIQLAARGDLTQLQVESFALNGDYGQLTAQSTLTFSPHFKATGSFNSEAFNPQWMLPEWPGKLNGSGQIQAEQTSEGLWQLAVKDLSLQGQLKKHDLTIAANTEWQDQLLNLSPLSLQWGDNRIKLDGQLSFAKVTSADQLLVEFDIPRPDLFLPVLSGEIQGNSRLAGSLSALNYDLSLTAQNLQYQTHQINQLTLKGTGQWPDQLQADISANEVYVAEQNFSQLQFLLKGSQQQHRITGDISHQDLTTHMVLAGGWFDHQKIWKGQIMEHDVQLRDSDMQWQLQAPADMIVGHQILLSPACWQSLQGDGEACFELDVQTDKDLLVTGSLQLKNLQAGLFHGVMPQELKINGLIQGTADLSYQQQALSLTADLKTDRANMSYRQGLENSYQVAINKAVLTARQQAGQTEINSVIELDDGGYLQASATLNDKANSAWPEIDAEIDGELKHSRFLVALSPELEQLQGEFTLTGQIKGALNRPVVDLSLQQKTGFLVLRQTGSRLTNMNLSVNSQEPGLIGLNLSADSDTGSLQSSGQLNVQVSDNWSYQGELTGTDFRLLTLPEITVNINPELTVEASPKAINITGNLSLPMAEVNIKNLPPSAATTSSDVVIHRARQANQKNSQSIPVHYDVTTEVIEPIDIQLIGLQGKMAGRLRVYDKNGQTYAEGRLNLTEGFYKLYGQRLDIEYGELIFNGPIDNPGVDVKAYRKSDDGTVTAGILLSGSVNQLQSTLYSEPAMSQLEALSYLATGRGLNEGGGTDGEQLAQAAILLGLKRGDSVFSQIQNAFGIDVLTIKQGVNNEDSYIEAGQNISDDLYVGYSQGLFNRLGFWILRYKINDALRLETTQGENQTVDLIYVRKKK